MDFLDDSEAADIVTGSSTGIGAAAVVKFGHNE